MEQSKKQYGLQFCKAQKVRKTKKGDLMVFINDSLVITINKNYVLKILLSEETQPQQSTGEAP